ncbi:hypothetical protein THSYN_07100 [Candidatus Thiodictyon syntrophicum]|uniref:Uncharacterized protein n=1 Tax=Candidatus Thiodictyon syntrophicum TaxID=1166950 RepID=A0A2K8U5R1_9GAMM|nr:hypothetical protein THSYN_07100 [Candidatus Thiodictyon syntrophicum]
MCDVRALLQQAPTGDPTIQAYIDRYIEQGRQQGVTQGVEQGRRQGEAAMLLRLIDPPAGRGIRPVRNVFL